MTHTADKPQIKFHDQANFTKPERVTGIISKRTENDGPTFNAMISYWLHHRPKNSPSPQLIKPSSGPTVIPIETPPGNSYSTGNTTDESKDHNWRQHNNASNTNEAVFEGNWPHPEEHDNHYTYINNPRPHNSSVDAQISRKTDGHLIVNKMDNSLRNRLRDIQLSEWITIRDKPDEEPPDRSPIQRPHTISERPIPSRAGANETMDDGIARRITIDYGTTR